MGADQSARAEGTIPGNRPDRCVTPGGREDLGGIASGDLGGLPIRDIVRVRARTA